ncbi:MAG: NUDIX domain-containing protein [Flavobacteriaceae bacterium]|jgi:ADP-ribose pyrophosphatase YjhB (NUDIX family)|nr:NUDIX domain-containing protein [Flavobacteriaceae bacterium]
MEEIRRMNVRVYALLIHEEKLLFLKEMYAGNQLLKLPGGGLELGEGTKQTLEREFMEELNLKVIVKEHFYTQDFFLRSRLTPDSQLLSIYYKVECEDLSTLKIIDEGIAEILWIPLEELNVEKIPLPVDKVVIEMLMKNRD